MREYQTRAAIIAHLSAKVAEGDWVAVREAAHDLHLLEILEARSKRISRPVDPRRSAPLDA